MIIEVTNKLIINYRAAKRIGGQKAWCELPYPGHPKGCPNYPSKCNFTKVEEYYDLSKPHWFSIIEFNIGQFAAKMKAVHPEWSDRQCRCVLYWQNGVRKLLNDECKQFIGAKNLICHKVPEAMGVNVMLTMRKSLGLNIAIKPVYTVRKIALIGSPGPYHSKELQWEQVETDHKE